MQDYEKEMMEMERRFREKKLQGLRDCAREMQPKLQKVLDNAGKNAYIVELEGLSFTRSYIEKTNRILLQILQGEEIDYEALYLSITLEMIAGSSMWNNLRYFARGCV